jgi:hypothetical protein
LVNENATDRKAIPEINIAKLSRQTANPMNVFIAIDSINEPVYSIIFGIFILISFVNKGGEVYPSPS